jgi:sugar phosphate isomerase/epimerase
MPEVLLQVRPGNSKRHLNEAFEIAEKAGFDGVELDCSQLGISSEDIYLCAVEHNIRVKSLIVPQVTFRSPMHYLLHGDVDAHLVFHAFKPDMIVFGIPNTPILRELSAFMFKDRVLYYKELYGNEPLCIENGAPVGSLNVLPIMDVKRIRDFCYEHDVFIAFDVSNCAASGGDIIETYDMIWPRVKSIHISDYGGHTGRSHLMPGEGLLPLGTLLSHAKANGFSGKVIVELDQAELADKDESDTIILHKELIGFARSYLEKAAIKSEDAFKI